MVALAKLFLSVKYLCFLSLDSAVKEDLVFVSDLMIARGKIGEVVVNGCSFISMLIKLNCNFHVLLFQFI